MKKDVYELSAEVQAVSMLVTAISFMFNEDSEKLTDTAMKDALFGVAQYLDRIADDMEKLE